MEVVGFSALPHSFVKRARAAHRGVATVFGFARYLLIALSFALGTQSVAAESKAWPPRNALMLSSNVACSSAQGSALVRSRLRTGPGEFEVSVRKGKSLNKLLLRISRNQKKLKNKKFIEQRPEIRRTIRQLKRQARQLTSCAERLGLSIGCSISVQTASQLEIVPGLSRSVPLQVSSSCQGPVEFSILEGPSHGQASVSGAALSYQVPGSAPLGTDGLILRACAISPAGIAEGCSAQLLLPINRCHLEAEATSVVVLENRESPIELTANSTCSAPIQFEVVAAPQHGTAEMESPTVAGYRTGYRLGADEFYVRPCDSNGAGCGSAVVVQVVVEAGESFQGAESSLAPYREHVSAAERAHLIRKLANSRFDLLSGQVATWSLGKLVDDLLLDEELFSPELKEELETVQTLQRVYGRPIRTEEFIPNWREDFPGSDNCVVDGAPNYSDPLCFKPIIPATLDLSDPAEAELAFERWFLMALRPWHRGNHRYHFGSHSLPVYYLLGSRYRNPLRARLTHFWFGHFGTSVDILNGFEENLIGYHIKTIEREAMGSFRFMMLGRPEFSDVNGCPPLAPWEPGHGSIICDAASNRWLSNDLNTGNNQNFARELLELYMTSPHDEVSGVDNYSDPFDIVSGSRFVSGIRVPLAKNVGGGNVYAPRFEASQHSSFPSSMFLNLGALNPDLPIVGESLQPGELVAHVLDNHPGVANFIASKLFGTFVYPDPSEALVAEMGALFKDLDYDIRDFLRVILRSEAMFSARAARKNCVSSPLETYSRILNSFEFKLMSLDHGEQIENQYRQVANSVENAGEVVLGYPTVFSYDYCGRGPGVDGSTSWLDSHLLVARVTNFTKILKDFTWYIRNHYDLIEVIDVIKRRTGVQKVEVPHLISFISESLALSLSTEEYAILEEYFTHRRNSSGGLIPVEWNDGDATLVREKMAGLMVILSAFQQSATH